MIQKYFIRAEGGKALRATIFNSIGSELTEISYFTRLFIDNVIGRVVVG